jgi:hypothetical protein
VRSSGRLQRLDQFQARNVGQLDVHDHEVGDEQAGPLDRLAPVGDGLDGEAVGLQQVAEQLAIEVVVLDNQNSLPLSPRVRAPEAGCAVDPVLTRKGPDNHS